MLRSGAELESVCREAGMFVLRQDLAASEVALSFIPRATGIVSITHALHRYGRSIFLKLCALFVPRSFPLHIPLDNITLQIHASNNIVIV
jgi:SpoVK/Ycf46/Vps4 family AAA+-type ATPase